MLFLRKTKKPKKHHLVSIGLAGHESAHTQHGKQKIRGGAAYFVAKGASTVSNQIGIVTRVGKDFDLNSIKRSGIDARGIKVIPTGKSFNWHSKYDKDNERVMSRGQLNVGSGLSPKDIPKDYVNAKHIHIATMPPELQIKIIEYLRKRGCKARISIDTVEQIIRRSPKKVREAISKANIVFLNEREFELLKQHLPFGSQMVVRKLGSRGAELHHRGKKVRSRAPKIKVVIDPTGAGDILAGTFLTLLAKGYSQKEALKQAVKTASHSTRRFGVEHLTKKK